MKSDQKSVSPNKQSNTIARSIALLAVGLIAALQLGCSSTGSSPTHQVFSPPANFGSPQGNFQGQGQFFNPGGQFNQGGSGTSFQPYPAQFNQGGSGTSFPTNSGSGSRGIFGVGFQRPLSEFQPNFNPFALPKTTC